MTKPGQIALANKAGFPRSLLVPVAPPNAQNLPKACIGKAPAMFRDGSWRLCHSWQNGVDPSVQDESDLEGCNCGLRLGTPIGGHSFLMIDVDTEPHPNDSEAPETKEAAHISLYVSEAMRVWAKEHCPENAVWMRLTRPGRSAFLVALDPEKAAGGKGKIYLSTKQGTSLGVIEVLCKGQQTVIGGMHTYGPGTPIRWSCVNQKRSSGLSAYPDINNRSLNNPGPIMRLNNFEECGKLVEFIGEYLNSRAGICVSSRGQRTHLTSPEELSPVPAACEIASDSSKAFIDIFEKLPHDSSIERETYVSVMRAAAASIHAARKLSNITDVEAEGMKNAAIAWAARWEDPKGVGSSIEEEEAKWNSDYARNLASYLGWYYILKIASDFGCDGLINDYSDSKAKVEFEKDTVDLPENLTDSLYNPSPIRVLDPEDKRPNGVPAKRRNARVPFDVKTADIQIADALQDALGASMKWVPASKSQKNGDSGTWIVWSGEKEGGWSTSNPLSIVRERIQDQLVLYVARHNEIFGNNDGMRAKITSESRVRAMESLLKSRLSVTADKINSSKLSVQTPTGMIDIPTGRAIDWEEQRLLLDQRCTLVTPQSGPCPLFDSVVNHLACNDPDTANWMWSYFGYALSGDPKEHLFPIVIGPGGNGKSLIINCLHRIFGTYSTQVDRRVLAIDGKNDHPTALNALRDKRLWCMSEFEETDKWNEPQLKALSGRDSITARGMHQDMDDGFTPQGTFFIVSNHIPALQRVSQAVVRRFRVINARVPVPKDDVDLSLEEKIITNEAPQVLAKIIKYAQMVFEAGSLPEAPAAMTNETKSYFVAQDKFFSWFSEECSVVMQVDTPPIKVEKLHAEFQSYVKRLNEQSGAGAEELLGLEGSLNLSGFISAIRRVGAIVETDTNSGTERVKVVRGVVLKKNRNVTNIATLKNKEVA